MTRITAKEIECPKCGHSFKIVWEASINTWMDPDLIQKVIDDAYHYTCPNCNDDIHLRTQILINCPKGMFWISNTEDLETKMKTFRDYEVLDEKGNIARPTMTENPPSGNLAPSFKTVLNAVRDFKDDILKDIEEIEDPEEAYEEFHLRMDEHIKRNNDTKENGEANSE